MRFYRKRYTKAWFYIFNDSCIVQVAVVNTGLYSSVVVLQVAPVSRSHDTGSTSSMSTRGCGRSEPQKVSHPHIRITRLNC